MSNVLITFAHGNFPASRVNRAMIDGISDLENVTFNNLDEHYPNFQFDVEREQALLVDHDKLVLQFPMYWYSTPALMKHWIDVVWAHKFAYGGVYKLEGKTLAMAISAGGSTDDFTPDGFYGDHFETYLRPLEMSARFCKMKYQPPFAIFDTDNQSPESLEAHGVDYRQWLSSLIAA